MNERADITWHQHSVDRTQRESLNGHAGFVVWFTGLSGCGKSTIANCLDEMLFRQGIHGFLLDGDNVRHGLNASPALLAEFGESFSTRFGLAFSEQDRVENIRRVGHVAQLFASAGIVTLATFVSPYRRDREQVRQLVEDGRDGAFVEVFVDTPLEVCEARDPKGLYKKARAGEIPNLTGINAPYEAPDDPEIHLRFEGQTPHQMAISVWQQLAELKLLPEPSEDLPKA